MNPKWLITAVVEEGITFWDNSKHQTNLTVGEVSHVNACFNTTNLYVWPNRLFRPQYDCPQKELLNLSKIPQFAVTPSLGTSATTASGFRNLLINIRHKFPFPLRQYSHESRRLNNTTRLP